MQIPNAGDNYQSCYILTVTFNRIKQLHILDYNIYSSTLIYTNIMIATALRGCKGVYLYSSLGSVITTHN